MKKRKKCKYCDKIIKGSNDKQVDTLYSIHLITQHKDKVVVKER